MKRLYFLMIVFAIAGVDKMMPAMQTINDIYPLEDGTSGAAEFRRYIPKRSISKIDPYHSLSVQSAELADVAAGIQPAHSAELADVSSAENMKSILKGLGAVKDLTLQGVSKATDLTSRSTDALGRKAGEGIGSLISKSGDLVSSSGSLLKNINEKGLAGLQVMLDGTKNLLQAGGEKVSEFAAGHPKVFLAMLTASSCVLYFYFKNKMATNSKVKEIDGLVLENQFRKIVKLEVVTLNATFFEALTAFFKDYLESMDSIKNNLDIYLPVVKALPKASPSVLLTNFSIDEIKFQETSVPNKLPLLELKDSRVAVSDLNDFALEINTEIQAVKFYCKKKFNSFESYYNDKKSQKMNSVDIIQDFFGECKTALSFALGQIDMQMREFMTLTDSQIVKSQSYVQQAGFALKKQAQKLKSFVI